VLFWGRCGTFASSREPLKAFSDLPCHYSQTNIAWSPDERLFLTGTSVEKDGRSSEVSAGSLCCSSLGSRRGQPRAGRQCNRKDVG